MDTLPPVEKRARFIHAGSGPPTGYVYEIHHEGESFVFQSGGRYEILRQLRLWYTVRGLSWPGDTEMNSRLEHFVCQLLPPGFCHGGPKENRVPFLSVSRIRTATTLFTQRVLRGARRLVSPEEADRRALICANCPKNLHGICTSCAASEFLDIFSWFIQQGRTTKYDSVLDTCAVCGCLVKAKVHIRLEDLSELEKHSYPENCWLHGTPCHREPSPEEKEQGVLQAMAP